LGGGAAKVVFYIFYLYAFCGSVGAAQFLRLKIYNNRNAYANNNFFNICK